MVALTRRADGEAASPHSVGEAAGYDRGQLGKRDHRDRFHCFHGANSEHAAESLDCVGVISGYLEPMPGEPADLYLAVECGGHGADEHTDHAALGPLRLQIDLGIERCDQHHDSGAGTRRG